MKWLFGWGMIFVVSWGLGAIVCGITLWLKNYKTTKIAALFFFGLPVVGVSRGSGQSKVDCLQVRTSKG